jgi:transposase
MAKYKHYDYSQDVLIPVSLKKQLMPGTLEFAIHHLVDTQMDTSIFDDRYNNDETGRWAYDPKILLKVILLGYSRGIIGSRKIERACKENVTFMALACGQHPDHSTIATFVSSMTDQILPLFRDVLLVCEERSLLGGTFFALDGCKLPSNASMSKSGKLSDLEKKKERIEKRVEQLLKEQVDRDKRDDEEEGDAGDLSGISNENKQIEKLRKEAKRIEKFLKENGAKIGKQGREVRSNITDNESALMVSTHGNIQGYNGQALVDSKYQVIVHGEVFGEAQDHHLVPPVLDGAKQNMEAIGKREDYFAGKTFTADSNYHDPTNLMKCDEEELDAYIPDKRFRNRDPRFQDKRRERRKRVDRFTLADFKYNEGSDEYVCPNGKALRLQVKRTEVDGVFYRRYQANADDCKGCELKVRCIRGRNGKRRLLSIPVGRAPGNLTEAMAAKVDSEKGRKIYPQRLAIVEPVFANIRTHKGMNRFTLRGKIKVNIQWLLYCMVHNMGKITSYGFT